MSGTRALLLVLQVGAALTAATTALLLLGGDHPPEYVVADALVVLALVVSLALPRRLAVPAYAASFGFGLGVFTVAFGARLDDEGLSVPLGAAVVGSMAGVVVALVLLLGRHDRLGPAS